MVSSCPLHCIAFKCEQPCSPNPAPAEAEAEADADASALAPDSPGGQGPGGQGPGGQGPGGLFPVPVTVASAFAIAVASADWGSGVPALNFTKARHMEKMKTFIFEPAEFKVNWIKSSSSEEDARN